MTRNAPIPPAVLEAARARSEARRAHDWPTADRLRAEIEAAGWRVIDSGTEFRLEPTHPPDTEAAGTTRYGRTESVPSRLEEPADRPATIVVVVAGELGAEGARELERSLAGALGEAPPNVDAVVVVDGLADDGLAAVQGAVASVARDDRQAEVVATSAVLGQAAALNIGIRRSRGELVIVLDPSVVARGNVVVPLAAALGDPTVAIAGPFGLVSADLRRFEEVAASGTAREAASIQGYLMAFRRADAVARGPLDEGFRYYRNLDIWWSFVLRDEGQGRLPRRALVVPDVPARRGEPRAWTATPEAERERLSKRNFYRLLDRFRTRLDLAVGPSSD